MRLDNIFKLKCPICGCNNKLFTQRLDDSNKPVGYKLICCGCGNKTVFTTSHMSGADIDTKNAHDGKSICFQPSFCKHTNCKLYGTCSVDLEHPEKLVHKGYMNGNNGSSFNSSSSSDSSGCQNGNESQSNSFTIDKKKYL